MVSLKIQQLVPENVKIHKSVDTLEDDNEAVLLYKLIAASVV